MSKGIVYIGMDLGTYKTSVASSTGVRDSLPSAVGWPKDLIARTMLGRDVVFGKDLVDQRLALNIVRPFEKGVLKYNSPQDTGVPVESMERHKEAAKLLVEHAVKLTRPPQGCPVYGVIGAPSRATAQNKGVLIEAARGTFDAVMIVPEPFTIAYGMNRLTDTLVIDIGAGTIDICPIFGTFPADEDQVTLPIGGDMIDELFHRKILEAYPGVQMSANMVREIKERYGCADDLNEKAVVTLPVAGKPRQFDVTEPLKFACQVIVPPIVEAVRNMVEKFDPEFQHKMLTNIILGGGGSQMKGLERLIEESLKEYGTPKVKRVPDAMFAGATGALKLAMGMPLDCWDKIHGTTHHEEEVAA
jgi:rod shape-determining protein MreB